MSIRAEDLLDKYTLRHWNVEDGLPEGLVLSIEQMPDGFLWLTTPHYLVRFDGVNFVRFPEEPLVSPLGAYFRQLYIDHQGNPWICGGETVLRLNGQLWQRVPLVGGTNIAGRPISRVTPDGETVRSGKLEFFCIGEVGGKVVVASTRGVHVFDGRELVFARCPGVPDDSPPLFTSAAIDDRGEVWLTGEKQVLRFRDGAYREEALPLELGATRFYKVVTAGADVVWVQQVDGRLFRREDGRWAEVLPAGLRISCVLENEGMKWIGSVEGLHRVQGEKWLALAGPQWYGPRDVRCLTVSRDGCLWIGTSSGFYRLQQRSVSTFRAGPDLGQQPVTALWPAGTNEFWAASRTKGLLAGSPGGFRHYTTTNRLKGVVVSALLQSSDRQLWVGTQGSHLSRLETNGSLFQVRQKDGDKSRNVTCLFEDSAQRIWVGTREGLLAPGEQGWLVESAAPLDTILAISGGQNGMIWVGTQSSGLWEVTPNGGMYQHRSPDGLPSDTVRLLHTDADGILWIGTPAGVARWKGLQKTVFRTREGLPDDDIRQMLDDGQGHLWLGTRYGLVRVSKGEFEEVAAGRKDQLSFLMLGEDDGLTAGLNTGGNVPLSVRGMDGRLWFCAQEGLAMVDPATLRNPTQAREPQIERLRTARGFTARLRGLLPGNLAATRVGQGGPILLPPGSVNIEFSFTLPAYTAPERALFQTWLEGYEAGWSPPAGVRKVTYPRLVPGNYRFRLRASPGDGVWLEASECVDFAVGAFYYQTAWFRGLAGMTVLIAAGMGSGLVVRRRARRKLRELQREQARELAVETERARIARDIHDDLGATLTQIAMLSESAQTEAEADASLKSKLTDIFGRAHSATRQLDEIVWAINPGNDTVEQVVVYLCQFADDYLELAGLSFRLDAPDVLPAVPLNSAQRHHLFLAAREALQNAVKHARATEVWLRIKLDGHQLHLLVEDNGRGCRLAITGTGHGLANMRERMTSIGGQFDRRERPGGGTVVEFSLPLSREGAPPVKL
jgi:signal transduction histidine kinase/ligand-binding sensor domain-containing protein